MHSTGGTEKLHETSFQTVGNPTSEPKFYRHLLGFLIDSQLFDDAVSTSEVTRHVARWEDFYDL
jgi:hypothetical protein